MTFIVTPSGLLPAGAPCHSQTDVTTDALSFFDVIPQYLTSLHDQIHFTQLCHSGKPCNAEESNGIVVSPASPTCKAYDVIKSISFCHITPPISCPAPVTVERRHIAAAPSPPRPPPTPAAGSGISASWRARPAPEQRRRGGKRYRGWQNAGIN